MAQILLPKELHPDFRQPGRKPVAPAAIDWANPLAKNLSAAFFATADGYIDLVQSKKPAVDSSSNQIGIGGLSRNYDNSPPEQTEFANSDQFTLLGGIGHTIFAKFDIDTLNNYTPLIAYAESTTTQGYELRIGRDVSTSRVFFVRSNTNWRPMQATAGAGNQFSPGDKNVSLCITSADNNVETITKGYTNGRAFDMESGGNPGVTGPMTAPTTKNLFIGAREDNVTRLDGRIYVIYLFERELDAAEVKSLHHDTYQLLKPASPLFYFTSEGPPPVTRRRFVITG